MKFNSNKKKRRISLRSQTKLKINLEIMYMAEKGREEMAGNAFSSYVLLPVLRNGILPVRCKKAEKNKN